ncbi:transmembrane protein 272-like isoform X2 [Watersipora subatra]|uniref:transmembrane protein 272-like isoform X2 n=1 Tax=Watersipora subatra TaxID=2589382 RepID=UPI00355B6E4D
MGSADPEAPPPSYDSIFGELKAQKQQSDGMVDYAKRATSKCCGKVVGVVAIVIMVIFFLALGLALPIAEIVIGSKYLYDCPAERYLTIYLIVSGVFSIISGCTSGGSKAASRNDSDEDDSSSKKSGCCNSLVGSFLIAWLIAGTVWVTKMVECQGTDRSDCFTTNVTESQSADYCLKLVYDFTYWDIMAKWIMLGVFVVLGTCCCCVLCCVYCCTDKSSEGD